MASTERGNEGARARTGFILLGVVTVLATSVFFLDVAIRATAEGERIVVHTPAAPGLRPGSAVWIAGRPVGRVLSVGFRPAGSEGGNIEIRAVLDRGAERHLRADASAEIRASDLLEPVVVAIEPGSRDAGPLDLGVPLRTGERRVDREFLLALADTLLAAGRRLAEQAGAARATFRDGRGSLQRLRADRAPLERLEADLERLRVLFERDLPMGTLGRLATDTIVGPAAASLQARLDAFESAPGRAGAERAADAMSAALEALEARVTELARRLEAGEGTLGRGLVDGELGERLEELRETLRALVDDLLHDPRWLRVRVF